jgi:hypothetical protein
MKYVLAALAGLGLASPAMSAGWTINDLGAMDQRADCMRLAETVFNEYDRRWNSQSVYVGNWTVGGYGLRGDPIDAIIMCPVEGGLVAPFLVVHNSDNDSAARKIVAERLVDIWDDRR